MMNITPMQNNNQTTFGAKLKIEYIGNIGKMTQAIPETFHYRGKKCIIQHGNIPIKKLTSEEEVKLEKLAAQKGVASDRIVFKINENTDEYIVGETGDMGARISIEEEKQGIKVITDINNDLDSMDLSRKNNIFHNGHEIAETSPFGVLENYLKSILGINK